MYVIQPLGENRTTIAESMLTASSVPETPPAVWSNIATYPLGEKRSVAGTHNTFEVYESVQAGNLNNAPASSPAWWRHVGTTYGVYAAPTAYVTDDRVIDPVAHVQYVALANSTGAALTDETKWLNEGPTNRWRALDLNSSTGTTAPSPVSYTITPSRRIDAAGLASIIADSFTISMKQGGEEIWTYSESLSTRVVRSWKDWLTKGFTFRDASMVLDLPLVSSAEVTITFYRSGGPVSVGALFLDQAVYCGRVQTEPSDGADNYSRFSRNIEGSATSFIAGRVIPILSATCKADAERVPEIRALRNAIKDTPAFWGGLRNAKSPYFGSLQRVGVWRRFEIVAGNPDARISLDVEEA